MTERFDDDAYMTPRWAIDAIIPHLPPQARNILEPACGTGNIVEALMDHRAKNTRSCEWSVIAAEDINPSYVAQTRVRCPGLHWAEPCDFRENREHYDLTITNPPFKLAQEFAAHCIKYHAACGGAVALLLRLAFLEGVSRAAFHCEFPSNVYVLKRRPKFRDDCPGGDRWAYAWFMWGAGLGGQWEIL